MILTQKVFNRLYENRVKDLLASAYNVYKLQCDIYKIIPLSLDEFGKAVNVNLSIEDLKKKGVQ